MPVRSFRTRPRLRLLAAATAAFAVLSLTACQDTGGVRNEGASPAASKKSGAADKDADKDATEAPESKKPSEAPAAAGAKSDPPEPDAAQGGAGGDSDDPDAEQKRDTCNASISKVTAKTGATLLNRMLVSVTNTGPNPCDLYGYPSVRFEGLQSVPPVDEGTKPQAVVTLKPGATGYAMVFLSAGDGSGGSTNTSATSKIGFYDRNLKPLDQSASPALNQEVTFDDKLRVSYWQQSLSDTLSL
jgi:hypothetical protein